MQSVLCVEVILLVRRNLQWLMGVFWLAVFAALGAWFLLASHRTVVARDVELKVMTFNVWNAEDSAAGREGIITAIRESGADLIGLQEMGSSALRSVARTLDFHQYDQRMGSEAVLSRYRIVDTTPERFGVEVELAPGHTVWLFNTHLNHAPYGPYQLNGITYNGGRLYDPTNPTQLAQVISDQMAARGSEVSQLLQSVAGAGLALDDTPVFLTGDFNEPSHLDWTQAAVDAGVHVAEVQWPTSSRIESTGFRDSWRTVYPDVTAAPGRTWSPVYPPTYLNQGDNPRGQDGPVPEPQDRIDIVYYAGERVAAIDAQRVGPERGDLSEELETPGYPSDHNAVVSTFVVRGMDTTRLDFRALGEDGEQIPATYGSRVASSPGVAVSWQTLGTEAEQAIWQYAVTNGTHGAARLAFQGPTEQPSEPLTYALQLNAWEDGDVQLMSFAIANASYTDSQPASLTWELWSGAESLVGGDIRVPALGTSVPVAIPAEFAAADLQLRLHIDARLANQLLVDDIAFQQAAVPEPVCATLPFAFGWLAICLHCASNRACRQTIVKKAATREHPVRR